MKDAVSDVTEQGNAESCQQVKPTKQQVRSNAKQSPKKDKSGPKYGTVEHSMLARTKAATEAGIMEAMRRVVARMQGEPWVATNNALWIHTLARWAYEASRSGTQDQIRAIVRYASETQQRWQVLGGGPANAALKYSEAAFLLALAGLTDAALFDAVQESALGALEESSDEAMRPKALATLGAAGCMVQGAGEELAGARASL